MAGQNMDLFETYFKKADLDHDGRISGAEAVSFFQGSGLSKQVLAQIWMHADQNRAGFLGRQEFYNALKLVTVAQSKRDLTPEIVKAALFGPASSKIPPPQINLPPSPPSQSPAVASSPTMQMGAMTAPGYRGPVPPNQNLNQQYYPSPGNQVVRPSQGVPGSSVPRAMQSVPGVSNTSISPNGLTNPGVSVAGRPSMGMSAPGLPGSGFATPGLPSSGMSTPGLPGSGMPTPGLPSSGMSTPGLPGYGMSTPGLPGSGMSTPGIPGYGMSTPGLPGSGMSTPGFSGPVMSTPGLPSSGMSTPGLPSTGMSPGLQNSNISTDWLGGRASGVSSGPTALGPSGGASQSSSQDFFMSSQTANRDSRASAGSGAGLSSNSNGGGDPFAAFQFTKSGSSTATSSVPTSSAIVPISAQSPAPSTPTSSAIVPVSPAASQPSSAPRSFNSLQSAFANQPLGGQSQQAQTLPGAGNATSDQSQPPWPKMTNPGVQKYTKVFMEVDTDRDGKITGEEARKLFLSWRLPREVLKQVWDLADQDNDSMLSLREFCIALYLMERYREGRPLPVTLPNSIMFDECLMRMTGLPNSSHANASWGGTPAAGPRPVQGLPVSSQPVGPAASMRPVMQSPHDMTNQFQPQKPRPPAVVNSQANQLGDPEQSFLQPSVAENNEAEKKAEKLKILDSREKLDYYRTKMQELVLYKSRCDNRLNEIIERAIADKREAESLGKKYEEKYKQVAEIASKLTIEDAKFREYQERKTELQQAITNMEQGGSADGILQVRADRIQSDFEELLKALSERCMKHGVEIKSAALIELPKGWQPGIQEGAAVWDEEWDKFEDNGLLFDKDAAGDAQNSKPSPDSTLHGNGTYLHDDLFDPDSPSNVDAESEKHFSRSEHAFDSEPGYSHSEDDSARSPHGSPTHRKSPSQDYSDVFARSSEADTDFNRSFDDQGWGNFDGTDDVDSVWGFNSKDQHSDRLFDSSGFGTDSPQGGNTYDKRSPFADSVPGTPSFSRSDNSPRYSEAGGGYFDQSSRFDSFNMNDSSRYSPPRETLTRFDSISSSRSGFGGHSRGFNSFDDSDPFGSSGPFKVSSETPKKSSDNWSSF